MIAARLITNSRRYGAYCAGCANEVETPVLEITGVFCTLAFCATCAEGTMLLIGDILQEIDRKEPVAQPPTTG